MTFFLTKKPWAIAISYQLLYN